MKSPARAAEKQRSYITVVSQRYTPVLPTRKIGIIFLRDSQPNEADQYLGVTKMEVEKPSEKPAEEKPKQSENDGLAPPEQFEYDEEKQPLNKKDD